ncbi:type VI secretion system protein ImpK [Luteibacter sp. Sphag1AF]|uniref:type IVB secretion system protein IcmH/DotU n=1 Tax=Luteibacter sp. Sphag1AF TaxID=2587031 RepID=UPI00161C34C3|nr:type VI secretion system protein ImpK [Luteibacter sp. Sphag1AF]
MRAQRVPETPAPSTGTLTGFASDALHIAALLKGSHPTPDIAVLRKGMLAAIVRFQATSRKAGVAPDSIAHGSYALCTLLDEMAGSTDWGAGRWAASSLLMHFHAERGGGERVFDLIDTCRWSDPPDLALAELYYVCLALGMEGRYRIDAEGKEEIRRRRDHLYLLVGDAEPPPRAEPRRHPPWVRYLFAGAAVVMLIACLHVFTQRHLDRRASALEQRILALSPPPADPVPRADSSQDLIRRIAASVSGDMLEIVRASPAPHLRLVAPDLFASGSARVASRHADTLRRLGGLLDEWPGPVRIVGHSDSMPLAGGPAANRALSLRRAQQVHQLMQLRSHDHTVLVDGKGAACPLGPDDTSADRAVNRRVDIYLDAQAPTA